MLSKITSSLNRDELNNLQLWFHRNNIDNKIDLKDKTDQEIAKMFLSQDRDLNNLIHDFHKVRTFLEGKNIQCTHTTRLALAKELSLSDYEIARMENVALNKDIALEYYQKAVDNDINQEHPDMMLEYADFLYELQNYATSEKIYETIINGPSKERGYIALNKLGNLYYNQKKYNKTEECYIQATKSTNISTKQEAHTNLGAFYKQVKEGLIQL